MAEFLQALAIQKNFAFRVDQIYQCFPEDNILGCLFWFGLVFLNYAGKIMIQIYLDFYINCMYIKCTDFYWKILQMRF